MRRHHRAQLQKRATGKQAIRAWKGRLVFIWGILIMALAPIDAGAVALAQANYTLLWDTLTVATDPMTSIQWRTQNTEAVAGVEGYDSFFGPPPSSSPDWAHPVTSSMLYNQEYTVTPFFSTVNASADTHKMSLDYDLKALYAPFGDASDPQRYQLMAAGTDSRVARWGSFEVKGAGRVTVSMSYAYNVALATDHYGEKTWSNPFFYLDLSGTNGLSIYDLYRDPHTAKDGSKLTCTGTGILTVSGIFSDGEIGNFSAYLEHPGFGGVIGAMIYAAPVPEPGSGMIFGAGLLLFFWFRTATKRA